MIASASGVDQHAAARPAGQLRAQTLDPLADARWASLVGGAPTSSIFHHVAWLRLLQAQYRYPLRACCLVDEDDELVAGLPLALVRSRLTGNRLVALPFSDMCEPLCSPTAPPDVTQILAQALSAEHERTGLPVEVRASLAGVGHLSERFLQHEIPLDRGSDEIRSRLHKRVKQGIARAERDGVQVHRGTSLADLDSFYSLHLGTRRRQGVPTQPKSFIRRFAALFEDQLGFVLLATLDGQAVAGAVYLSFNGVLTQKYAASLAEYQRHRPVHAIMMEAIRCGSQSAQHTFDLGRTDLDNEGLIYFKRSWGGHERELVYSTLSGRPVPSRGGGLPGFVTKTIRHTPALTGRLAGAALYRHFG